MNLLYRKQTHPFRSRGLFQFLRILQEAYPNWVDLAGIEAHLPGIHARQLARFIELLEAAGLPLVRYETKTRGRYQLAVKPESISFRVGRCSHMKLRQIVQNLLWERNSLRDCSQRIAR